MTFEEVEAKFNSVWKQMEDFIPMGSKEEAERIKKKEVPKEKVKEMMQLVPIKEVYVEALQVKHLIIDWKSASCNIQGQRNLHASEEGLPFKEGSNTCDDQLQALMSIAGTSSTEQPPLKGKSMWSDQEKRIQKIDRLVRSFLIQGLPNDIYSLIDSNKTVKDLWDALARHMLGSEYGEQDRKAAVLYEYKTFKATEGELLLDTYIRYLQVINDLKKCGYLKDNCELNFKFLNNLQPEWKRYATMMRQNKNLMNINIDALYNILKQNQGDVNDAMGSKKKTVVVTSDPLALMAERTNVSRSKEKVVVSSDSEGSEVDDFSELKKITALLAKDFNRRKFYFKPTNNNLRTSYSSQSANKKQEFVKTDNKKVERKDDEKKRDMSKIKDEQVLLAEDQAWMESSSDSDQEINANMVFMAQIEKVLFDSEASSSSADEKISKESYYVSESESESEFETSEYYDNSTNYGLFVNNDDDQEIFHDAIESASETFIENQIDSQKDYDKSDVDHNHSEEKDQLVDKLIRKFNKKIVKCQKRIEKANQQSKDFENQNKDLQAKYDVLKSQTTTFEMNNKELNEQLKELIEKNNDLLAQTKVLKDQLQVKHVVIDTHVECHEKYTKLEAKRYFEKIDSPFQQTSSLKPYVPNVILEKIIIDLEDEVVNLLKKEKANLETIESLKSKDLDTFSSVRRPKHSGVIWKKNWSSNTSNADLSYTWVFFLHSKDEASEVIISFIKKTQVNLQLQVQRVRTDNGMEFKNNTLAKFFDEDVGKFKEKGDIGVFVGYSKESAAFRIYNKQTRKIHESVNVNFDELSEMASKQFSLEPGLSNLNEIGKSSNPSVSQIMKSLTTNVETSINEEVFHEVSESFQGESFSSSLNDDVQQISEEFHDPSNVQTFYQPYPHEKKWTKDHPLHKIIGDPKSSVRTRGQLANSRLFSCLLCSNEPANVAEALKDIDWVSAIQEEIDQFARLKTTFLNGILKEEVYVGQPPGFVSKQYPDHVYALDKALCGLKQAPRAWYDVLSQFLIDSGFQKVGKPVDHTVCRSMIGSLMYVTSSRPDIMFATSESEYVTVSGCCAQVLWMRTQPTDYGFFYDKYETRALKKKGVRFSVYIFEQEEKSSLT
nr:hypothetical protein [Tanacetum cinerariifolium]